MTTFTQKLKQLSRNPEAFRKFNRGIERETLRYQDCQMARSSHPAGLGSAYANNWITTDFSESQLEFITPVSTHIDTLLAQLKDIHHFTQTQLGEEYMWPLSMPYKVNEDEISLAQYGSCNAGKMKTLYRQGLNHRYGSKMQIISGVHFNFSFPDTFWDELYGKQSEQQRQVAVSDAYFGLIRNYYRFGWLLPYFFGASPVVCSSFVSRDDTNLSFEESGDSLYLPYATSLRLSDIGYSNSSQDKLNIGFNSLGEYLAGLKKATHSASPQFERIGTKVNGEYRQLNSNVLQLENELYAPIRPKRTPSEGEKTYDALSRHGVEYVEIRALDVNPYSSVGIGEDQIRFLDLFLTWAVLKESKSMDAQEQNNCAYNWHKVIHQGRKTDLTLICSTSGKSQILREWAGDLLNEIFLVAKVMDQATGNNDYQLICQRLGMSIKNPNLTYSGRLLADIKSKGGLRQFGHHWGIKHAKTHLEHRYQYYSDKQMEDEVTRSWQEQRLAEKSDTLDFDEFLVANAFSTTTS